LKQQQKQLPQQRPEFTAAAGGGNLTHCSSSSQELWLLGTTRGNVFGAGGAAVRSSTCHELFGSMGGQAMHEWQQLVPCILIGMIFGICGLQGKVPDVVPVLLSCNALASKDMGMGQGHGDGFVA